MSGRDSQPTFPASNQESSEDIIAWFAESVRRLGVDDSYERTIVLHLPTARRLVAAIQKSSTVETATERPPPEGYASWYDAAVDERTRRVAAEKALAGSPRRANSSDPHPVGSSENTSEGVSRRIGRPKCDGNHGGPPCADPECWNSDGEWPCPACNDDPTSQPCAVCSPVTRTKES